LKDFGGRVTFDEKAQGRPVIAVDLFGTGFTTRGWQNSRHCLNSNR